MTQVLYIGEIDHHGHLNNQCPTRLFRDSHTGLQALADEVYQMCPAANKADLDDLFKSYGYIDFDEFFTRLRNITADPTIIIGELDLME